MRQRGCDDRCVGIAAEIRPTQQRAGGPSGAPGLLPCRLAGVSPGAPGGRLSLKEAWFVNGVGGVGSLSFAVVVGERRSSLYGLRGGRTRRHWRPALGAEVQKGPSGGQTKSGASRGGSEGLVVGEHVPDRFGELSGDVDLSDLGGALAAQAALVALVALAVGRVGAGRAWWLRASPSAGTWVAVWSAGRGCRGPRLVDARARAGVAAQLLG